MSLIELRQPKQKLEYLLSRGSRRGICVRLGIQPVITRRIKRVGPKTLEKIEKGLEELMRDHGVPPLRFPDLIVPLRNRILDIDAKEGPSRREAVDNLRRDPGIALLAAQTHTTPAETREETVLRAMINLMAHHINSRIAEILLTGSGELKARRELLLKALRQAQAAVELLRQAACQPFACTSDETGVEADDRFSDVSIRVMAFYAAHLVMSLLSFHRENAAAGRGEQGVFATEDLEAELHRSPCQFWDNALEIYPPKHPNRLHVALDIISVGSMKRDRALALKAWRIAAEEEPNAANLETPLHGRMRPLSQSDLTQWLRDNVGNVLPV